MAVGTKQSQIGSVIVVAVPIDVVHLYGDGSAAPFAIPAALASQPALFDEQSAPTRICLGILQPEELVGLDKTLFAVLTSLEDSNSAFHAVQPDSGCCHIVAPAGNDPAA